MDEAERERIRREFQEAVGGGQEAPQQTQQAHGPEMFQTNEYTEIRHVVGVVSGKGGVGKSMVTGVLATELARAGKRVGILDADITGPSIPRMFGLAGRQATGNDETLFPVRSASGIPIMSANLLLASETDPILWRGPVISGLLMQFYSQTAWGALDYLLCDMPPGTADVAITTFQSLPVEGLVIVSSPQDLVQMVVGKAVHMAEQMHIPVLGIVENMSYLTCPHCGEPIELYGKSRLQETADAFGIPALGRMPVLPDLAAAADSGRIAEELPEGLLPDAVASLLAL